MEERKTFLEYAGQTLIIFGFSIIFLMVISQLVGEEVQQISSMFQLGDEGLSIGTMSQFLLASVVNTILRYLFFSGRLIKTMNLVLRVTVMFFVVAAEVVLFTFLFDWFPMDQWIPWASFAVCFTITFACSLFITIYQTGRENKKLEQALAELREKWEEERHE